MILARVIILIKMNDIYIIIIDDYCLDSTHKHTTFNSMVGPNHSDNSMQLINTHIFKGFDIFHIPLY